MWCDVSIDVGGMRYVYRICRCVVVVEAMTKDEADGVINEEYNDKELVYVGQSDNKRQNCD